MFQACVSCCMEAGQSLWWDVEDKSIQGSAVVTPLSFLQRPDINSAATIICPPTQKPIISISGKKHSFEMSYLQFFLRTSNFNRSAYMTFLNTIFVFASWPVKHNLVSWQYRRFNLWYCCHQIMRRASLQHHYISESCLHSWEKLNWTFAHFGIFFVFDTVWMHR